MPFVTGPVSVSQCSTRERLCSRTPSPVSYGKHIFMKEFEHGTTQVAVSVKTKSGKDSNKKRSVSSSNFPVSKTNSPDTRKKHEPLKQTNIHYEVSPRSRTQPKPRPTIRSHLASSTARTQIDTKHLTWDEALRDNNFIGKPSLNKITTTLTKKDYQQRCIGEPVQDIHHRSIEVKYRRPTSLSQKNETSRFIERISSYVDGKQSISDLSTAKSSSTIKSADPNNCSCQSDGEESGMCYVNQSVQCKLPSDSNSKTRFTKHSSTEASQQDIGLDTSVTNNTKIFPSFYHPITSLGFQCQELMLHVDKSSVLHKIVRGIEYNLSRLCPNMFDSKWREFPDWPVNEGHERSLNKRLAKIKELTTICKSVKDENTILQETVIAKNEKVLSLEEKLTVSNKDKDELCSKLDGMTKKAEEYSKALSKSAQLITELQEEVKVIPLLRSMQVRHNERMQEVVQQNELGKLEVQKMKLEQEKYKTIIESKDLQLQKYREEIVSIQKLVVEQFSKLQTSNHELKIRLGAELRRRHHGITDAESVSSNETSANRKFQKENKKHNERRKVERYPTCSSPSSDHSDSSLGVYPSWEQITPINPELNRDQGTEESIEHIFIPFQPSLLMNETKDTTSQISTAGEGPLKFYESLQAAKFHGLRNDTNVEQQDDRRRATPANSKHSPSAEGLTGGIGNMFEELKRLTHISQGIKLPSPPKEFVDLLPPPSELSHWSDSFEEMNLFPDDGLFLSEHVLSGNL